MAKETTKFRILTEGARIIHQKGFNHTGIQEILDAAEVPKGSFYFYFKNKDDFGLQLIDFYTQFIDSMAQSQLSLTGKSPIERLRGFFRSMMSAAEEQGFKGGCPIGNLAQEMADQNEAFRTKMQEAFRRMSRNIAQCLKEARELKQVRQSLDPQETADFLLNSWEGALLRMKAENSLEPLLVFENMVFNSLLKP
ncbi:TetR/AcrR family transcriptional regulator [Desulfomonile tiedjei]|uniref:Transcriptional regulator n=1 Tax=Desulfomonile tiedjei (strain ATCC 49306 / DSM 6799 / DCB-1) TaxID=706587 RepID=I4CD54_DESTA|nr:TetR/AcrR family transcriptional regulator [Desulfomonile tiedjei]AFM27495.1 transcriptional regulator [Desulfomonile tiedjei DSM 6799]